MSQHPGGMVISTQPLIDLCPVQPASMEGRQMVQWDKDSCGDAGFLKIDLLGLDALGGRAAASTRSRVRGSGSTSPASPTTTARSTPDPGGGDHGRVPDRVARADADAEADAAGDARRPHRAGGAGATRPDHRRGGIRTSSAGRRCERTPSTRCPTSTRRSSLCCGTRSARSSSRTRCSRCRWRSRASRPARPRGCGGR